VEWQLGIVTTGIVKPEMVGVNDIDAGGYQAIDYHSLRWSLERLAINDHDVFLDYGSGMGRAVIFAARFPFRKVIGVELSPYLYDISRRNLVSARSRLKCSDVQLINADAVNYELPPEVTVIHFYNSFVGNVLDAVVGKIRASLASCPRDLAVIYQAPRWAKNRFSNLPEFRFRCEVPYFDWLPPGKEEPATRISAIYEFLRST
jgi:SAM-dependent methyltransferase